MMRNHIRFEWDVIEKEEIDTRSADRQIPSGARSARTESLPVALGRWTWSLLGLVLLTLLAGGFYLWQEAQAGLKQAEIELHDTVALELWAVQHGQKSLAMTLVDEQLPDDWEQRIAQEWKQDSVELRAIEAPPEFTVQQIDWRGDQVQVQLVVTLDRANGPPRTYREVRFYRATPEGWRRTAPDAAFWGPWDTRETALFTLHFQRHDAAAVAEVSDQMDAVYRTMRQNLGLAPAGKKVTVVVSAVDDLPPNWDSPSAGLALKVPSPTLLRAPLDLSAADILYQSVLIQLGERLLDKMVQKHVGGMSSGLPFVHGWLPLHSALRVWQIWDIGGPLSAWRYDLVHWMYMDVPTVRTEEGFNLPEHYDDICDTYRLWEHPPLRLSIPLTCTETDPILQLTRPPIELKQIGKAMVVSEQPDAEAYFRTNVIALATLIEYAVATYGRDRLPVFVRALSETHNWDILIPSVFEVTAEEFQTGWQSYLSEHYSLSL